MAAKKGSGRIKGMKKNFGGPSKYKKEFCKDLIAHMEQGFSYSSFPAILYDKYKVQVVKDTLRYWEYTKPDFARAKETAVARSLRFFERFMRIHITGIVPDELRERLNKKMSSTMVIFALKTRFYKEYGDQLKLQGVKDGDPIKTESTDLNKIPTENLKKILELLDGNPEKTSN